jgi:hypothetical protein
VPEASFKRAAGGVHGTGCFQLSPGAKVAGDSGAQLRIVDALGPTFRRARRGESRHILPAQRPSPRLARIIQGEFRLIGSQGLIDIAVLGLDLQALNDQTRICAQGATQHVFKRRLTL